MGRVELNRGYEPIWDMQSQRSSCVIPEQPLLINRREEFELNQIALGIWRTVERTIEVSEFSRLKPFGEIADMAKLFPEGATMPPVIRADLIRTEEGFRVVEIDPVTAISLGETALLASIWEKAGYETIESPTKIIARSIQEKGESALSISVPLAKSSYRTELDYLARELVKDGIDEIERFTPSADSLELSAFIEDGATLKGIRRDGWRSIKNPLWGSLGWLSMKDAILDIPEQLDNRLGRVLPQTVRAEDALSVFGPNERVVFKPVNGTGSRGVFVGPAEEGLNFPNYIVQELLCPQPDRYGDGLGLGGDWISRVSIYAGRVGLCGAQVTARKREGDFTNAHGQADAIQTALAVKDY